MKMPVGKRTGAAFFETGFTLVELLVAMSALLILFALSFGVASGVSERAARVRAQGELAALAQALESYRAHYGDYPWVDPGSGGSRALYAALIGHRGATAGFSMGAGRRLAPRVDPLATRKGKHFVELNRFTLFSEPTPETAGEYRSLDTGYAQNYFLDPWGMPYQYRFKEAVAGADGSGWKRAGCILFSPGPDGLAGPAVPRDGVLMDEYREDDAVVDNIYPLE